MGWFQRKFEAFRRWRSDLETRRLRNWFGELLVLDDALQHRRRGKVLFRATHDEIARLEIYKVDMITVDDIRCDIHLTDGSAWTIDEELAGWSDALAWLEALPGFSKGWRTDVINPPMEESRRVVFIRQPTTYDPGRRRRA